MTFDRAYLQSLLALSEAAYDATLMPAGYTEPVRIVADLSVSAALLDPSQLDFGFVCKSLSDDMVYVVFRGTANTQEWADDACAVLVGHWWHGNVHKGFRDVFAALEGSVAAAVKREAGPITFIGHSLGAALATLCSVAWPNFKSPHLVTFASPRVGDCEFADLVQANTETHLRIVNSRDIVTHVPGRPLFSHTGGTITFHGTALDWRTAHSEPLTYGPAIAAMPEVIESEPNGR
ncbi:MAG TPA: lipase family protein [Bryobacteraceae bacterium]|jgi:hypothetical protein|nr:lipase family protein [Bryobacteraceae bacterium]